MRYSNKISVDQVNKLRRSLGFRRENIEQLQNSINGSTFIVAVYDEDEAIGFSRLIWDGGGLALVEDVLVNPQFSNQGIEKNMLSLIIDYLKKELKPGFGIQVDVKSWPSQINLYTDLGFKESTTVKRGLPMHLCLTDNIKLTDKKYKQCGFEKKL